VTHGTTRIELGTVGHEGHFAVVPGEFHAAVRLVVTVAAQRALDVTGDLVESGRYPPLLTWQVMDSIAEDRWAPLPDATYDQPTANLELGFGSPSTHQTRRFVLPFGPRLAVRAWPAEQDISGPAYIQVPGVVVDLFWQNA
jgi:hypothetical protein